MGACGKIGSSDGPDFGQAIHLQVAVGQKYLVAICQKALRTGTAAIQREVEDVVRMHVVPDVDPHTCIRSFVQALH